MPVVLRQQDHCSTSLSTGVSAAEVQGFGVGYFPVVRSASPLEARAAVVAPSRVLHAPATTAAFAAQAREQEDTDPELDELRALIAERDERIRELESCLRQRGPAPLASGTGIATFAELAGALRAAQNAAKLKAAPAAHTAATAAATSAEGPRKSELIAGSAGGRSGAVASAWQSKREANLPETEDLCAKCGSCRTIRPESVNAKLPVVAPATSTPRSEPVDASSAATARASSTARSAPLDMSLTATARATSTSRSDLAGIASAATARTTPHQGRASSGKNAFTVPEGSEAFGRTGIGAHGAATSSGSEARAPCIEAAMASKLKHDSEGSACSTSRSWRTLTPGRSSSRHRQEPGPSRGQHQYVGKPEAGEYSFAAPARTSRPLVRSTPAMAVATHESMDPPTARGSNAARSSLAALGTVSSSSPTPRSPSACQLQQPAPAEERDSADDVLEVTAISSATCCPACGSALSCSSSTPLRQAATADSLLEVSALQPGSGSHAVADYPGGDQARSLADIASGTGLPCHSSNRPDAGSLQTMGSNANAEVHSHAPQQSRAQELRPATADAASQTPERPPPEEFPKQAVLHWTPLANAASAASLLQDYLPKASQAEGAQNIAGGVPGVALASAEAGATDARRKVTAAGAPGATGDSAGSAAGSGGGEDTDGVEPTTKRGTGNFSAEDHLQHAPVPEAPAPPPWPRKLSPPPRLTSDDSIAAEAFMSTPISGKPAEQQQQMEGQSAQPFRKPTPWRQADRPNRLLQSRRSTPLRRAAQPTSHVVLAPAQALSRAGISPAAEEESGVAASASGRVASPEVLAPSLASEVDLLHLTAVPGSAAVSSSKSSMSPGVLAPNALETVANAVEPPPPKTMPGCKRASPSGRSASPELLAPSVLELSVNAAESLPPRAVAFQTARQSLGRSATLLSRMKREATDRQLPPAPRTLLSPALATDVPKMQMDVHPGGSRGTAAATAGRGLRAAQSSPEPLSPKLRYQADKFGWK